MCESKRLPEYLTHKLAFLLVALLLAACGGSNAGSNNGSHPIVLQVVDAGGYSSQVQPMLQAYQKAHPDKISKIVYPPRIQAPQLPGKLKAEEDSGNIQDTLIISGYDGVASSTQQDLVEQLIPAHSDKFPNLDNNYLPAAKAYNDLAHGNALVFSYTPSGPVFEYDPAKVPNPPTTIDELRTWIKAHPHQFLYARPANSGPGRTLLMGLPYLLGDKNPQNPTNGWDKTWAFLHDIGSTIDSYPTRTGDTMTALGTGQVSMIASTLGWDINPRYLHQVPAGDKTFVLNDTTFVSDAAFMMLPKSLDPTRQSVMLDLMSFMLQPQQQAFNYDDGYFYPGPAIKNVPASMATTHSQQVLQQYGRPEYDTIISQVKIVPPLLTNQLVAAFGKWDKDIGSGKYKTS
ncbi:MAG TPA: extracellular solute-binding protein [Ktedonobacteraceae bacterium]|nr:extracellular solute-binding protein [Ktedonobacteraceae bacterium]